MTEQPDLFSDNAPDAEPCPPSIVAGYEHCGLYIDDEFGPWPEFIPGYHLDIRQPSRLGGLCSRLEQKTYQPKIQDLAF